VNTSEEWRQVPFAPAYSVSSLGRVRRGERICKCSITNRGYLKKRLLTIEGYKNYQVHRLILEVFIGKSQLDVNHINGVKTDNRLDNLEYCTRAENNLHAYRIGLKPSQKGAGNGFSKLTDDQVKEIKRRYVKGVNRTKPGNISALAKEFGISKNAIGHIVGGRRWTHVQSV
jgi:hypothetical protein